MIKQALLSILGLSVAAGLFALGFDIGEEFRSLPGFLLAPLVVLPLLSGLAVAFWSIMLFVKAIDLSDG